MKISDQELVRRTLTGNLAAYEELVLRYQQTVFGVVYRFLQTKEEAEDITQESFIKCYQKLDKFDQGKPFAPWIYRIASNTALSRLRWLKRRPFLTVGEDILQLADNETADPATTLLVEEEKDEIAQCLSQLKPLDRLVIILRYYEELSYDEMAYILKTRRNTIEVRLYRARKKLRDLLENQEVKGCSPVKKQKN